MVNICEVWYRQAIMCSAMVLILACPALSAKVTITFAARLEQIPGAKNVSFEQVAQVLIAQFNKDYPDIEVKYVPLKAIGVNQCR
jgi:ABC-type glycerol-3-phosphate transport system substrate-binding protein